MRRRRVNLFWILFIILVLIVLPTGTPEDLVTTVVLINVLGAKGYVLLALFLIFLMLLLGKKRVRI